MVNVLEFKEVQLLGCENDSSIKSWWTMLHLVKQNIIEICRDGDYVDLWAVMGEVQEVLGSDDEELVKSESLLLIEDLLNQKKIRPGKMVGSDFCPIHIPIEETMRRLEREYKTGDKMDLNQGLWFAS